MEKNSFKELEALYIKERGDGQEQTRQKIESNIQLLGFISNVLDLYVPKAGSVIQTLSSVDSFHKPTIQKKTDKNI